MLRFFAAVPIALILLACGDPSGEAEASPPADTRAAEADSASALDSQPSGLTQEDSLKLMALMGEGGSIDLEALRETDPELAAKVEAMTGTTSSDLLALPDGMPEPPAVLRPRAAPDGAKWPDASLLVGGDALEHARDGWTIINFWADWCAPCVAELPDIRDARDALEGSGVSIVTLQADTVNGHGTDNAEAVFARRGTPGLPVLSARDADSAKAILTGSGNPNGVLPFNIIFAPGGRPVGVFSGGVTDGSHVWSSEAGLAWLRALPGSGL